LKVCSELQFTTNHNKAAAVRQSVNHDICGRAIIDYTFDGYGWLCDVSVNVKCEFMLRILVKKTSDALNTLVLRK